MYKNQKGSTLLILAILAFVVVAGYFLLTNSKYLKPTTNPYSAIQDNNGLSQASRDLDSADTNEMNTELNQLNSEASAF